MKPFIRIKCDRIELSNKYRYQVIDCETGETLTVRHSAKHNPRPFVLLIYYQNWNKPFEITNMGTLNTLSGITRSWEKNAISINGSPPPYLILPTNGKEMTFDTTQRIINKKV